MQPAAVKRPESAMTTRVLRVASILVALLVTVGAYAFRDELRNLSAYGYLGIFVISILGNATLIFPIPGLLATFVGGSLYDPWLVGLIAGVGHAIGELTGYLLGYGSQGTIENYALYRRVEAWMRRRGDLVLFIFAVLPNPVFDVGGIAAGALGFPWWRFLLAVWAGKTVKTLLVAWAGTQSGELLEQFLHLFGGG